MDLSGLSEEEQLKIVEKATDMWIESSEKKILLINDVSDTFTTQEVKAAAKHAIEAVRDSGKEIIITLIGITGIKRVIAKAINREMYFAKNMDDAKEWLLSNA